MKAILLTLFLFPFLCSAQHKLKGKIIFNNEAVPYANVIISDSLGQHVTGTVSNDQGEFALSIEGGLYSLRLKHLNYETFITEIRISNNLILETIELHQSNSQLDEIIIKSSKVNIRREIDKTVVNVENTIAQSGNLLDALKLIPGVVIQNEQINMLGKSSVRVAIDGQMVELSGIELNQLLQSMSANQIKEIEVITNPSAKYDAEGNGGIINIISSDLKFNSWRNNISFSHHQARYHWQTLHNNFNYQKDGFHLLCNLSVNRGREFFEQYVEPNYSENPQKIASNQVRFFQHISPRILLDYDINNKNKIGFQYLSSWRKGEQLDDLETRIFNTNNQVVNYLIANDTEYNTAQFNSSYNLFFNRKIDTSGHELTLNFDILDYLGTTQTKVISDRFDKNFQFINQEFANVGDANHRIRSYSGKVDISRNIQSWRLGYGMKISTSSTAYALDNFDFNTGEKVFNPLQSNAFRFRENISAAYVNASRSIGKKWEFQSGLRAESTSTIGLTDEDDFDKPIFNNDYLQYFPTLFFKYNHNEDHVYSWNFGRRINRPAYSQLNPSRSFLSGQSSQQGNPFLRPSFSNNIEFNHYYKYKLSSTLSYSYVTDIYSFIFDLDDDNQTQNITYKNLFNEHNISLMSSYPFAFFPFWKARSVFYVGYNRSQKLPEIENIRLQSSFRLYGSLNNSFDLNKKKTLKAEINMWYDSPYQANIYRFGQAFAIDLSIQYQWKKNLHFTIQAYDIFNSSPRTIASTVNNIDHLFIAYPNNRYLRASIAYNFGNEKISTAERNFGNEDLRRRSH